MIIIQQSPTTIITQGKRGARQGIIQRMQIIMEVGKQYIKAQKADNIISMTMVKKRMFPKDND